MVSMTVPACHGVVPRVLPRGKLSPAWSSRSQPLALPAEWQRVLGWRCSWFPLWAPASFGCLGAASCSRWGRSVSRGCSVSPHAFIESKLNSFITTPTRSGQQ